MNTVFIKFEFWALILSSLVVPAIIYYYLLSKASISRTAVALFGLFLLFLAGADIALLKALMMIAKHTPSLMNNLVFNSEFSIALYLLPLLSASVGCNLISHLLISHLIDAERSYEKQHPPR